MPIKTSRTKKTISPVRQNYRDSSLIVIAVEGKKTEKRYFELDLFRSSKIQVEILPPQQGESAPQYVLARLNEFKKKFQERSNDHYWLVCDVDRWPERNLAQICREANKENYSCAISNPCFELWLYLHNGDWCHGLISSAECKRTLNGQLPGGCNMSNITLEKIGIAIQRAEAMDTSSSDWWPNQAGTHVYKLANFILDKLS